MKYVTFHKLKIKNFLSIGEEEVVVDITKGLHIITGINKDKEDRRNGVGKSTIADALYFVIFGNTIRDIKKEFVSNNLTNGTCVVELSFNVNSPRGNDNFIIVRSLNPSRLQVYKNGVDKTRDSIANTNEYIEAVLSSSPEVFQNCVIMTVNNTLPFMAKSKTEKRKFIEQIFNLQVFSDMLSLVREDHNKISKNFDIENAKFSEIQKSVSLYQMQKENKIKEAKSKIDNTNSNIESNKKLIAKLESEVNSIQDVDTSLKEREIEETTKGLDRIADKIEEIVIKITEHNSYNKQLKDKLAVAGTDQDVCPVCLRPVKEHDRKNIEIEKNNLKISISDGAKVLEKCKLDAIDLRDKQIKVKNHISNLNRELNDLKSKIESNKLLQTRIDGIVALNETLINTVCSLSSDTTAYDNLLNEASLRMEVCKVEIDAIKKSLNLLDTVKFVVSEEGVKSYIVKKILQSFNSKLAYYLKKLDSNSLCVFNEYFEEEILNEKGKMCVYNNFSGAERKAIDLACLFSFMDMRKHQGNVYYNISIYDELFDSSLDEKGVEIVLGILKERSEKYGEGVFIISHRKESIKSATGNIIYLEKRNGITRKVNFVE